MKVERIDHINIQIPENEVEKALEFYHSILGFSPEKLEKYRNGDRTSFAFRAGSTSMIHIRPVKKFNKPQGHNYDHFCLIVDENIASIKSLFESENVEILRESNPLGSKGRAPALYVKDPFGYMIEIKEFR